MRSLFYYSVGTLASCLLACTHAPSGQGSVETGSSRDGKTRFRIETVASGVEVPWSIVFTPDRRMLFTERPGRVRVAENEKLRPEPLLTIPDVEPSGESGAMGLVLHPDFASNHLLYIAYSYRSDGRRDRVVRYRETGTSVTDRTLILEDIPAAQFHAGCRLRFGPDRKLYITTGDATDRQLAQRLDSLAGKILRLNDDGTVPADNPFVNQQGVRPEIWSYGNRNSQGIDWQPGTNTMFETEHGPSGFDGPGGGDEVNIIERGKNYGWPVIHHTETHEGMESPLLEFTPAVAPASGMFYRGSAFPEFRNNFFFGCLRGACIIRVVLEGRRVVSHERLLDGSFGRIREVAEGPDGAIYFSTSNRDGRGSPASNDDRILKLVPLN
jgi:glucose/arabinose dehydrogenase